jgi:hypothetical protein
MLAERREEALYSEQGHGERQTLGRNHHPAIDKKCDIALQTRDENSRQDSDDVSSANSQT